jgi:cytochrome c-type biogenesis protein
VIDGPFALAFAAGMLAVVNPCGFAMLPAYLAFFLGVEGGPEDTRASLSKALAVGLSVSAGFAATFGVAGFLISHLVDQSDVFEQAPWVSVVIGLLLAALGLFLLSGRELKLALPRLDAGGRSGSVRSMAGYGVSYAVVSIGCTLPIFLTTVVGTFGREDWLSGLAVFGSYGLGFTVLLVALTVAVALARRSLVTGLRRLLPHIQRISGALVLVAGLYVAWYGWYERNRLGEEDAVVDRVTGWSDDVSAWIQDRGATTLGLVLAVVIAAAGLFVAAAKTRRAR